MCLGVAAGVILLLGLVFQAAVCYSRPCPDSLLGCLKQPHWLLRPMYDRLCAAETGISLSAAGTDVVCLQFAWGLVSFVTLAAKGLRMLGRACLDALRDAQAAFCVLGA